MIDLAQLFQNSLLQLFHHLEDSINIVANSSICTESVA